MVLEIIISRKKVFERRLFERLWIRIGLVLIVPDLARVGTSPFPSGVCLVLAFLQLVSCWRLLCMNWDSRVKTNFHHYRKTEFGLRSQTDISISKNLTTVRAKFLFVNFHRKTTSIFYLNLYH